MTDSELLEFAAKSIDKPRSHWDYEFCRSRGHMVTPSMMWNPFLPAEAMIISARLRIDIYHNHSADHSAWVCAEIDGINPMVSVMEDVSDEARRLDCTCRAIVRAAAEIGKAMK